MVQILFYNINLIGFFMEGIFIRKKKRYSIDLCAICNFRKRFIYCLIGFSNAIYDSQVWAATQIHQYPIWYFIPGQYLLGDSTYSPIIYIIPLYKALNILRCSNRKFNCQLSSICIDIKHVFRMLKGWWKSFTRLRLILTNHQQYKYGYIWITAYIVMHNILLNLNDTWNQEERW